MSRQVITQVEVEQALASGSKELSIQANAIVTAIAAEVAQERGLRLVRGAAGSTAAAAVVPSAPVAGPADRDKVRESVIAALGSTPDGLEAVLDRVMGH